MTMKHLKICLLTAAFALSALLTGCGGDTTVQSEAETSSVQAAASSETETGSETITITDHAGNTVTLPKDIERIAVCNILPLPSVLTVFFDSAEKIVAMAPGSMAAAENGLLGELYPELLKADTSAIGDADVNTEELMKLDPQVVFYSASNPQIGESLTNAGFNAVAISVNKWEYNTVETLNQWMELLGQIFPGNDRTELVKQYSEESMALVQERTASLSDEDRARVFFLFNYSESAIVTSGKNFFGQFWADAIGAVNVAEELQDDNSVKVTLEQVYAWDPDIILMTNFTTAQPKDLYENTVGSYDWSTVQAIQQEQVYKMPLGMYRSYTPGVDTPITLLWLAKTVYPDLFADIDITQETIDYYQTVFGVTLTAEQAEAIFAPSAAAGQVHVSR